MYDLIIIGGGPAGLTAAIYAIRKRLDVLVLTKDLGGKTQWRLALPWLEDYHRTGFDVIRGLEVVQKFRNELEYLEFAHTLQTVENIEQKDGGYKITTHEGITYETKALIIASGTRQLRLKVPGEKEYMMRGLCYSALSYAPLFIDRTAVVIGDGELGLRSAAELATIARHVHVVSTCGARTHSQLCSKLRSLPNVTMHENFEVVEFKGDDYARCTVLRGPDGVIKELDADGIFVEMALLPNTEMVAKLVELDPQGRVKVDHANRTSAPGIFAAGDVTDVYAEQVLVAVGEGAKAALSAYEYLLPTL